MSEGVVGGLCTTVGALTPQKENKKRNRENLKLKGKAKLYKL